MTILKENFTALLDIVDKHVSGDSLNTVGIDTKKLETIALEVKNTYQERIQLKEKAYQDSLDQ